MDVGRSREVHAAHGALFRYQERIVDHTAPFFAE
jgi:hypothetical protein